MEANTDGRKRQQAQSWPWPPPRDAPPLSDSISEHHPLANMSAALMNQILKHTNSPMQHQQTALL